MSEESVAHYAVIADGKVVSVVVWDGVSEYDPGDGLTLVPLPFEEDEDGTRRYRGGIGWTYRDGQFVDERPVEEED